MNRQRRLGAAAEVVALYGLLGWIYVAAYAAVFPNDLDHPIAAVLPLRRDTFGVLAFAASSIAATALRARTGRVWTRSRRRDERGWGGAVLHTVFGYGLLAWVYLCVNSLTHPRTTGMQLTHLVSWPSEGSAAVTGFAASAVALFLLRSAGPAEAAEAAEPADRTRGEHRG
ncbi:MAG TPA: hypothetical protein VH372_24205 [Actinospica sp.]|nr:hypothetical protein [Actinospica sp.]